jgi:hypothetical protein
MLSGGLVPVPAAPPAAASAIEQFVHLNGVLRGHYHQRAPLADLGSVFDLSGSGSVTGFGHAFVAGNIVTTGFIAQGHAQGTLHLSGVHGTLTLSLTGPVQGGFAGLPNHFTFKTAGGTGKYRNMSDTGTATLVTIPGSPAESSMQGRFRLLLTFNPIPAQ